MQYTFSLSRRSLPVRCLCLLLIVVVLLCFFLTPRASAVALEATTIAYGGLLIGTILVGAGVVFSSHGDMAKVGAAMYKTLVNGSNAIGNTISSISAWAVEHAESVGKGALRVGKDLYQAVVDAFNASYSDGNFTVASPAPSDFLVASPATDAMRSAVSAFVDSRSAEIYWSYQNGKSESRHMRLVVTSDKIYLYRQAYGDSPVIFTTYSIPSDSYSWKGAYFYPYLDNDGSWMYLQVKTVYADEKGKLVTFTQSYPKWLINLPSYISTTGYYFKSDSAIAIPPSDLAYPSDDYLVKMPDLPVVDEVTGDVTYPSDAAYTKDAIAVSYPVDAEGVKVPDIPYDQVVDQSTGKALDDTGTDTDNPSKPGEGTDTDTGSNTSLLQKILDLLKNFFDSPSDFKLDFDGFKNLILPERFPFCIPFDMVKAVKLFAADAADFVFSIDLDTQYFSIHHTVDLTPYALPIAFFRYGCVIWFVWILISRTHDLIKW